MFNFTFNNNIHGVQITKIDSDHDRVLATFNDSPADWYKITTIINESGEIVTGFHIGIVFYNLDDFISQNL